MSNKIFYFKKKVGEGETEKVLEAGVNLNYLVNFIYDGEVLYLFLDEQIEAVRVVQVPVKKKVAAGVAWAADEQARTVKESYTIEVNDPEAIERFLKYQKENSI
jgi:hypothetical protein